MVGLAAVLIVAGCLRREFLGDGVRHLSAILSDRIQMGEPRWLLFPALASLWIHSLSAVGIVAGVESALRALVALSITSGILFLISLQIWVRAESTDDRRRAAALLLAASCGPFLMLFSDIAEPQVGAGIAAAGLAYARIRRDDVRRAPAATGCAIAAIAFASLIYQGIILAFAMLPLVVPARTSSVRRALLVSGIAILVVGATMVAVQTSTGTPATAAAAAVVLGERNPLTRSLMAVPSGWKYLAAIVAGPPQGIIALENYSGLKALWSALGSGDRLAITNLARLALGLAVTVILLIRGIRDRQWGLITAAAVLVLLPVIRNQQYAYVKFYVLWPIPIALLAVRCRARTIFVAGAIALAANGWLVGDELRRGRDHYRDARTAYATATPSTCWLTSGWIPPFAYVWPGRVTAILGTLATGIEPDIQRAALTAALRRCFCESDSVWTDTTSRDTPVVRSIARHFEYTAIDLASVLVDPREPAGRPAPDLTRYSPEVRVYSDSARTRACGTLSR